MDSEFRNVPTIYMKGEEKKCTLQKQCVKFSAPGSEELLAVAKYKQNEQVLGKHHTQLY